MSPASKSKSKSAARAAKEQPKASSKPIVPAASGNGVAASAYNPVSGTFHALEMAPPSTSHLPQNNGRVRNVDETDDHSGSSLGTAAEYDDSVSNNDSCSGESEDQKEKATSSATRTEPVPGSDTDKRDKIRQKNERKHQRQRERRAQELHERCSGYLMSRKLEVLVLQFVAMGFSSERATMALIRQEGRVEESIAWLLEGCDESKQQSATNPDGALNLKIDIAEEVARITDMEVRFKCTKQEVERAVVACEGDLDKAAETLKTQKQEPAAVTAKVEEPSDPVSSANGFHHKVAVTLQNSMVRTQVRGIAPAGVQQQRRDERDFNYTKSVVTGAVPLESTNKNVQSMRRVQPKPDWARPEAATPVDKRWPGTNSSPSASYSLAPSLQVAAPAVKPESRYTSSGNDAKSSLQAGMLREPIIVMQRPQSVNAKQSSPSTSTGISGSSPPAPTGWYANGISSSEMMKSMDSGVGHNLHGGLARGTQGMTSMNPQHWYLHQNHYQPFPLSSVDSGLVAGFGGSRSTTGTLAGSSHLFVGSSGASTQLTVPSSLGLFTGWGSGGSSSSSSPVDWSTGGSMPLCDYTSVDWTLDSTLDSTSLRSSSVKGVGLYDRWSRFVGVKAARPAVNGGVYVTGLQDGNLVADTASTAGSPEWTSPFAGKDLFSVPRQFVTSPSL